MPHLRFGPHSVELTHPDKPLFGKDGPSKADIADYYQSISEVMLPHLRDRPLVMHRFPDGIDEDGFYQQQARKYFPSWFATAEVDKESGTVDHPIAQRMADLVYLVQLGTIGIHTWLSRIGAPESPDRVVFDLDPASGKSFDSVRFAAQELRKHLEDAGLKPFVKTSGSSGLHVLAPIRTGPSFETVRAFAKKLGEELTKEYPDHFTMEQRKDQRKGRVYLDTVRNSYAFTIVAPYSIRPLPDAPVSAPLTWDEVTKDGPGPRDLTSANVLDRLERLDCPWKGLGRYARGLPGT